MSGIPTTDDEFRAFADDHLIYELRMVGSLARRFETVRERDRHEEDWLDWETRNAQIEAFAIHVRLLIDFFTRDKPERADDAVAAHYAPGWKATLGPHLGRVSKRTNKEIAHLTYHRQRVTDEAKVWNYAAIAGEMNAVIGSFLSAAASSPRLSSGFRERAAIACRPAKIEAPDGSYPNVPILEFDVAPAPAGTATSLPPPDRS